MSDDISRLMYRVFQTNPEGIKVFEYLASRFYDCDLYTKGDPYHSTYNIAQRDVIKFIINKMTTANITQGETDGGDTST